MERWVKSGWRVGGEWVRRVHGGVGGEVGEEGEWRGG